MTRHEPPRRRFLKQAGLTTAGALLAPRATSPAGPGGMALLVDPTDSVAVSPPARGGAGELRRAGRGRGRGGPPAARLGDVEHGRSCLVAGGPKAAATASVALAEAAEAFSLAPGTLEGRGVVIARGRDARGLVYALLELADVVRLSDDPLAAL